MLVCSAVQCVNFFIAINFLCTTSLVRFTLESFPENTQLFEKFLVCNQQINCYSDGTPCTRTLLSCRDGSFSCFYPNSRWNNSFGSIFGVLAVRLFRISGNHFPAPNLPNPYRNRPSQQPNSPWLSHSHSFVAQTRISHAPSYRNYLTVRPSCSFPCVMNVLLMSWQEYMSASHPTADLFSALLSNVCQPPPAGQRLY